MKITLNNFSFSGYVRIFLSNPVLTTIGRMTLSIAFGQFLFISLDLLNDPIPVNLAAYPLVSVLPIIVVKFSKEPLSHLQIKRGLTTLIGSMFYGYILFVTFEAPGINLLKTIFKVKISQFAGDTKVE